MSSFIDLHKRFPLLAMIVTFTLLLWDQNVESLKHQPLSQKQRIKYSTKTRNLKMSSNDFNIEAIENYANILGLQLNATTTGPYLRIEAYPLQDKELVGYLTAFIRPIPFGMFHLETIQVKNRRQNLGFERKNWTVDGPGISFIMGSYALCWASQRGCKKAQLLAVNDSPMMHAILIRLYSR